jgi:membrane associated rhomboid family serine protease
MGIYDRDYTKASHEGAGPQVQYRLPPLTPAVKWLLIANIVIFLLEAISGEMDKGLDNLFVVWGAVWPESLAEILQVWRLFTYQFLHSGLLHLIFNMLALFFVGPRLERFWGTRKFVPFYLLCGATGGLIYTVIAGIGVLPAMPLVGASGGILGVLAACAILFPGDVIIFIIIPMPIRVAALILTVIFIFLSFSGLNRGGNIAHLGGMAAAAAYIWLGPKISGKRRGAWDKRMEQQRRLQLEIDRVLDKVHEQGLASLSRSEKKMLQEATRLEQERRRNIEVD